jgi:HEAT repeat protein
VKDKGDGSAFAVQDLAEGLRGEKDAEVRFEQASALQRYGDLGRGAVSALGSAAADKDPKVQIAAATALGRIGKDARGATDDLLPLVKSADPDVRRAAVFALGRIDPTDKGKVSEAIIKFAADPDEATRKEGISSLGLLADKSVDTVKAVAAALADKDVEVRRLAAATLARFGDGACEADKELLAAFGKKGEDKLVRAYALHALCVGLKARNEDVSKVLPDILARLDPLVEKDAEVRLAICEEVGGLGPDAQSAILKLRDAEKDPVKEVRDAAKFAIKKIIAKKEEPKKDGK